MHAEYRSVLGRARRRPTSVRAVVVTGTPPAFCVGGDSDGARRARRAGRVRRRAAGETAPRPATACARSSTPTSRSSSRCASRSSPRSTAPRAGVGLGARPVLRSAVRLGRCRLTTAAPKLGLPAEYGMSWMLPRLVGVTRAADLLLSGRVVTPAETAEWGLWNGVEADGEATLAAAQRLRPSPRSWRRAGGAGDDEGTAVRSTSSTMSPAASIRRRAATARRGDGDRRVPRGCRRAPREAAARVRVAILTRRECSAGLTLLAWSQRPPRRRTHRWPIDGRVASE